MFGSSDSVFDFNPFEVGNWMTIGMMEEIQENDEDDDEEEESEWNHGMRSMKTTDSDWLDI